MEMTYGKNGLDLTKSFEKCRLTPYQDSGGVWTNGWGNTRDVTPGRDITQEQADADLVANVQSAVDAVNGSVTVNLPQNVFDALVDFTFTVGNHAFATSTLLRKLNAGDFQGANLEMDRWNKVDGAVSNGLNNRRDAEQELFDRA